MSQKAFAEFYETYLKRPGAADVASTLADTRSAGEYCIVAVEAGRAAGYDFTADDVRAVMEASRAKMEQAMTAGSGELSEEQLDAAVGGAIPTPHTGGWDMPPIVGIRPSDPWCYTTQTVSGSTWDYCRPPDSTKS